MTLISLTTNFGYPIIIGDVLTTSDKIEQELGIPVFLKGVNDLLPVGGKLLPSKLRQKVYIINNSLTIALACLEYEMKIFLSDIKNYFKYREDSISNLDLFLNDFDYSEVSSSTAIMLYAEKQVDRIKMHYRGFGQGKLEQIPAYETVFACGSGSDDFIAEAKAEMKYPSESNNPLYDAIARNYLLLARILVTERTTLDTIINYWGAGFELIYYDGNKFIKMDDITYIIWNGKLNLENGEYSVSPAVTMNFKYHEDILLITTTDGSRVEGYGVLPIDMNKEDVDMSKMPTKAHLMEKEYVAFTY